MDHLLLTPIKPEDIELGENMINRNKLNMIFFQPALLVANCNGSLQYYPETYPLMDHHSVRAQS